MDQRRAFENLPKGWKAPDAIQMLQQSEIATLQTQAVQQAARFEIMRKEDVDSLSRHEPMLKQEEALAELDASIDEWVNRLEQAENRRTRIRQKLLEHVAAAVALPVPGAVGTCEELHIAMGIARPFTSNNISTPPRSPVKTSITPRTASSSPSPQRIIAHVPSTIFEQPFIEGLTAFGPEYDQPEEHQRPAGLKIGKAEGLLTAENRRAEVESIRIYAGEDIAALLVDVEQQMIRMSRAADHAAALQEEDSNISDIKRELHREHSHELLQGGVKTASSNASLNTAASTASSMTLPPSTYTPPTATSTTTGFKDQSPGEILLTNAVFKPKTAISR
ncbi:hypothetical protein SLS53_005765 [Cytospora paraplurivora]|uniref:Up-regulated during septation protein 1 domain-containing protein n=1 Tax=Cytospora paraplurivora TaxID=2898453 RepID=A0AAN9UBI8_9PEZI